MDCFQYHTGIFGNIQSFNFANGQMLSSQAYKICFRQELDFCTISFTASLDTTPDPWELLTGNSGTTTTVANCKTTFLGIPDGGDTGHMDSRAQRYCGSYFDSSEGSTRNGQVSCESHQSSLLSLNTKYPFQPPLFLSMFSSSPTPAQSRQTSHPPQVRGRAVSALQRN